MCKICTLLVRINQLRDAQPVINDVGMAALALLAAESAPPQKVSAVPKGNHRSVDREHACTAAASLSRIVLR